MKLETLFNLLKKALKKDCVPVSAIIVKNDKIVSKAYNLKEKTHNPLDHAEIIAIRKATKKLKTWKLNDCEMFVTMKPCKMCETIIMEARINKVYFLCENDKESNINKNINYFKIISEYNEVKYVEMLKKFFKTKRK